MSDDNINNIIPQNDDTKKSDLSSDDERVIPMELEDSEGPEDSEEPEDYDLSRLGHVSDTIIRLSGISVESDLYKIARTCNIYLKEQKRIVESNLQKVAFGEAIDGMSEEFMPQALAYLSCRVEEISSDINTLEEILRGEHLTPQQIDSINRIYPSIYRECVERGTVIVNNDAEMPPNPLNTVPPIVDGMNMLGGFFDRIDNMGYGDVLGDVRINGEDDNDSVENDDDNQGDRSPPVNPPDIAISPINNPFQPRHASRIRRRTVVPSLAGLFNLPVLGGFDNDVKVPLKISVVEQMPLRKFDSSKYEGDKTCTVCFNEMEDGEEVRYTKRCCSKFIHKKCAYEWWDLQHTCPVCGKNLHTLDDEHTNTSDETPANSNANPNN